MLEPQEPVRDVAPTFVFPNRPRAPVRHVNLRDHGVVIHLLDWRERLVLKDPAARGVMHALYDCTPPHGVRELRRIGLLNPNANRWGVMVCQMAGTVELTTTRTVFQTHKTVRLTDRGRRLSKKLGLVGHN